MEPRRSITDEKQTTFAETDLIYFENRLTQIYTHEWMRERTGERADEQANEPKIKTRQLINFTDVMIINYASSRLLLSCACDTKTSKIIRIIKLNMLTSMLAKVLYK